MITGAAWYDRPPANRLMMYCYPTCPKQEYITELKNLCEDCPYRPLVREYLQKQIIDPALRIKKIAPPDKVDEYFDREINDALKGLRDAESFALQPGANLKNVSEVYIWNTERLKVLRVLSPADKSEREQLADQYVSQVLRKYTDDFIDRYERSREKDLLLQRKRITTNAPC